MTPTDYPFAIRPLTADEGGGYLIEYPDLPGCISDGETIPETIANGSKAQARHPLSRRRRPPPPGLAASVGCNALCTAPSHPPRSTTQ